MWRHLGRPSPFWLVELGPGRGTFVQAVLRTCQSAFPDVFASLRVLLIERSPALAAVQSRLLEPWAGQIALPVHRVVMREHGLHEIRVDLRADRFIEIEDDPSLPEIARQIESGGGHLESGQSGEVNLIAPRAAATTTKLIEPGYLLFLDYGAPATELYGSAHPRGTFRCYRGHTMHEDPYTAVGLQDLTAHVDFSAITRAVESAGGRLVGASAQQRFLSRLGLPSLEASVQDALRSRAEQRTHRAALRSLAAPHGLGRVLAVAYGLGAPDLPLSGFSRTTPLTPPPLPFLWTTHSPSWEAPLLGDH
jgi:SAM-dependent MidA family methyltransferase